MNVREMIQAINGQLLHNPKSREDRDQKLLRINEALQSLSDEHPWPFLQRVFDLDLKAPVSGANGVTATLAAATNGRLVVGSGTSWTADMDGQLIQMPDGNDYRIGAVDVLNQYIYLTTEYPGADFSGSTSWKVIYDRYALPERCAEVLSAVDRDNTGRAISIIDRVTSADFALDEDLEGETHALVVDDWIVDDAPDFPLSLTNDTASGSLPASTRYAYCYTVYFEGRESPPSKPVEIVTGSSGSTHRVQVSGLEDLRWDQLNTPLASGRKKYIYRKNVTSNGPWERVYIASDSSTSFYDDAVLPDATVTDYTDKASIHRLDGTAGERRYLRPYYRTGTDRTFEVRYRYTPRPLVKDSDVPERWPRPLHRLFWQKALADALRAIKERELAADWDKRVAEGVKGARRRYLRDGGVKVQAGNWRQRSGRGGDFEVASIRKVG